MRVLGRSAYYTEHRMTACLLILIPAWVTTIRCFLFEENLGTVTHYFLYRRSTYSLCFILGCTIYTPGIPHLIDSQRQFLKVMVSIMHEGHRIFFTPLSHSKPNKLLYLEQSFKEMLWTDNKDYNALFITKFSDLWKPHAFYLYDLRFKTLYFLHWRNGYVQVFVNSFLSGH